MVQYTARRLLAAIPAWFAVLLAIFFLVHYLPGDLADLQAGGKIGRAHV